MTYLALHLSRYVNGVARKHGEISRLMFGGYEVDSITNGVHAATWTSAPFQELFDRHMPGWREDNSSLRYAKSIPKAEIAAAHDGAKRRLLQMVESSHRAGFRPEVLTIGFARRATAYKRPALLFDDVERLSSIAARHGGLQLVFAGKAHPRDEPGKDEARKKFSAAVIRTPSSLHKGACEREIEPLSGWSDSLWPLTFSSLPPPVR